MSGFLFSTVSHRDSWRFSSSQELSRLASDFSQHSDGARPNSRPDSRLPYATGLRRQPSNPHLTALPELPEPQNTLSRGRGGQAGHKHTFSFDSLLGPSYAKDAFRYQPKPAAPETAGRFRRLLHACYGDEPAEVETEPEEQDVDYPKGFRWFLLLLSGALPYVVAVLDDTIIATIIPVLVNEFKSPEQIGWYASSYFLPLTIFMPLYGKSYSLWPIKWIFFISLAILLVGSIVCATAQSSGSFIAGRLISGTGAAGIVNGAMRIIGVSSPRKQRTFLEAAGALFMGVCTVTGPILGGVISVNIGWRWAFWINVPVAGGSLAVILFFFPANANQAPYRHLTFVRKIVMLDPLGSTTLVAGLACLISLLQDVSTSTGPLPGKDIALAIFSALLIVIFIAHELTVRPDLALLPRELLKHRAVWSCCVALFLLFAGFLNFMFFLSIFFQSVLGESAESSAIHLLPYVVAVSVAAFLTAIAVSVVRYYNPLFILGGICNAIGAGLIVTFNQNVSLGHRIGYEALMGLGVGFLMLGNVAPCQTFLHERYHAVANGLTFFSSLLGATIALPVSNTLFNKSMRNKIANVAGLSRTVRETILSDPTQVRHLPRGSLDARQLQQVTKALVDSIQETFILGVCCAVASAIVFWLVPWKPLLAFTEEAEKNRMRDDEDEERESQGTSDKGADSLGKLDKELQSARVSDRDQDSSRASHKDLEASRWDKDVGV